MAKNVVGLNDNNVLSMDYVVDEKGTKLIDVIYPVGSIYMSFNSTSPADLFGGTWTQIIDRFLYCSDNSGATGGENSHQHKYGMRVGGFCRATILAEEGNAGLFNYSDDSNWSLQTGASNIGFNIQVNAGATLNLSSATYGVAYYDYEAKTSTGSTMPQYITCYAWYRAA